ncbi:colicin immunity protein [Paraburkholderia heleia]|uniref:colicin immunity protein n=1 Tax=Paraburkholderia heleia TaxID=634127 RepID=UPI0005A81535|nr:colicin immunity protein [Paraburkholderia heleia]
MKLDRTKRYTDADDYFSLGGSIVMKLSAEAAISVCTNAAEHGVIVSRIEGGIWHNPGFEARIDCIWDGAEPPIDLNSARVNNLAAIEFIRSELPEHDTFIITAPSISGW